MNMMNTTGPGTGFLFLWGVHTLSVIVFFVGLIFLIAWALRTFDAARLQTWGIGLVVVGIIACLLTIGTKGSPWMGTFGGNRYSRMDATQNGMMGARMMRDMMMDDDAMGMSMDDMLEMLEGKTGDDFDAAFIEGMIPHHQGAIDMARMALRSAKHAEIKRMANDIISAQQREIDTMKQWQSSWGYKE